MYGRTEEECEELMRALENPVAYNSGRFAKPTRIVIDDPNVNWEEDWSLSKVSRKTARFFKRMTVGPKMFLTLIIAATLVFWALIISLNF